MINHKAARARLAELVAVDGVPVADSALDTGASFPLISIGLPRWTPDIRMMVDRSEIPIAVVVAQPGGDAIERMAELERIWTQVARQLKDACDTDQTLGGICQYAEVVRAEPRDFRVQGQAYPAQVIITNLDG